MSAETCRKPREPYAQLVRTFRHFGIDAVIDVGANRGQYGRRLRRYGYRGPILSIEPLPDAHAILIREAAGDPAWRVAPPMALGARTGSAEIEVSAERDMSSLLPQAPLLERISPSSRVERRLRVPLHRLDELEGIPPDWQRLFLKLDVQGYEMQVLEGAGRLWPRIVGLQVEMALVRLYRGEPGFREVVAALEARGYALHLLIPGYFEPKLARQLQVDGVFYRLEQGAGSGGEG